MSCCLPLLAGIVFIVVRMLYRGDAEPGGIVLAVVLGLVLFVFAIFFWLLGPR